MLYKDNMANLDFKSKKNNAKHKNPFGLKNLMTKNKKTHIMQNEQCKHNA